MRVYSEKFSGFFNEIVVKKSVERQIKPKNCPHPMGIGVMSPSCLPDKQMFWEKKRLPHSSSNFGVYNEVASYFYI